jgi:hypothetical protein
MKRGGLAALLGIALAVKMPYLVVILKWAGASGAAPAWTGVTAFMVTKKAERRISARPGRTPEKDYD